MNKINVELALPNPPQVVVYHPYESLYYVSQQIGSVSKIQIDQQGLIRVIYTLGSSGRKLQIDTGDYENRKSTKPKSAKDKSSTPAINKTNSDPPAQAPFVNLSDPLPMPPLVEPTNVTR